MSRGANFDGGDGFVSTKLLRLNCRMDRWLALRFSTSWAGVSLIN
jgi:hypothetical protein